MYKISANTLFIGKKYIYLPSCHSTNDIAASYISNNQVLGGEVFVTSNQIRGRGQRGNSWLSEPDKNITLSIILKPSFLQAKEQFKLNVAISLGILDFLNNYIKNGLKVKWPNDIYCGEKKIGGILIENFLKKHSIENTIVGIGINVNQNDFNGLPATSISNEMEKSYQIHILIEHLLECVESSFLSLKNGVFAKLKQTYISNLYGYQELHDFIDMKFSIGEKFKGEILGVDANGKLAIFNHKKQMVHYFDFKEVQFVNNLP